MSEYNFIQIALDPANALTCPAMNPHSPCQMCKSRKRFLTDVAEAREDSAGFIVGKPDNFPLFSAIGGFGPMQDIEKGDCELYFFLFREIIVFY